jgi:hypothetical protein
MGENLQEMSISTFITKKDGELRILYSHGKRKSGLHNTGNGNFAISE